MLQLSTLENAFTDALMDLDALRRTDVDLPGLRHYRNEIDFAVGRLCEALALDDTKELAHRAYRAVLGLGQLLESADSDDRRTRDKLDITRDAVAALLDALDPLRRDR